MGNLRRKKNGFSFNWLTCNVEVFKTLIFPCIEHHIFPWTLINLVAGLVTVPTVTAVGEAVFHPPRIDLFLSFSGAPYLRKTIFMKINIAEIFENVFTKIGSEATNGSLKIFRDLNKTICHGKYSLPSLLYTTISPFANDTNTLLSK